MIHPCVPAALSVRRFVRRMQSAVRKAAPLVRRVILLPPWIAAAVRQMIPAILQIREVYIMNKNIILCGVGGQGTVLASKLIAAAAMKKDCRVFDQWSVDLKVGETLE